MERLLTRDQSETSDRIERCIKTEPPMVKKKIVTKTEPYRGSLIEMGCARLAFEADRRASEAGEHPALNDIA
jgi:hypothetical protein